MKTMDQEEARLLPEGSSSSPDPHVYTEFGMGGGHRGGGSRNNRDVSFQLFDKVALAA